MTWELELSEPVLEDLYLWVDSIPLSKPKRKIERDFADGTLIAEIIRYYLPDFININNYISTSSLSQKKINWNLLNKKVFARLKMNLPEAVINDLCHGKSGRIEVVLFNLRLKIDEELELRQRIYPTSTSSTFSLNAIGHAYDEKTYPLKNVVRTSKSIENLHNKWVSRLDYEELKQQCLQQKEEIEILQAKMRRLDRIAQLKDIHIAELCALIDDHRYTKPPTIVPKKYKIK